MLGEGNFFLILRFTVCVDQRDKGYSCCENVISPEVLYSVAVVSPQLTPYTKLGVQSSGEVPSTINQEAFFFDFGLRNFCLAAASLTRANEFFSGLTRQGFEHIVSFRKGKVWWNNLGVCFFLPRDCGCGAFGHSNGFIKGPLKRHSS